MFPLESVKHANTVQLCKALWSWQLCQGCDSVNPAACNHLDCPGQRLNRLGRFFNSYKSLTASYSPDENEGLSSHADLLKVIESLRQNPDLAKRDLPLGELSIERRESAICLAMRVFAMVNCSALMGSDDLLESGASTAHWRKDVSLCQYLTDIFPTSDHPDLNDLASADVTRAALNARRLKKRGGLSFRPTDDLRCHLRLDHRMGTVDVFHHTAFLKEHLRLTKDCNQALSISDSLQIGALPRQLVLEVLDSIQKILFPLWDPESRALLQSLTSSRNAGFDPDCIRFESAAIRKPEEKGICYYYFGSRLMELYDEVQNPKPRGRLEKWLQRRSGARYMMMATLIGVIFAIILGLAGLAVSSYQTYIAYQQWKHPNGR
jgi:hypothetical protein